MVKEVLNGLMVNNILVNGKMHRNMELVNGLEFKVIHLQDNGSMVSRMVWENINGMEMSILANGLIQLRMDMVQSNS